MPEGLIITDPNLALLSMVPEFEPFGKIARLNRDVVITEKIDGTNAQIFIADDRQTIQAGSRTRWIYPEKNKDNAGFAAWVQENREELLKLGPGRHFGEWWGFGIQRGYGLQEKRFSLFHDGGIEALPGCVSLVPVLYSGPFDTGIVNTLIETLKRDGSVAVPGFMKPEGVVVYHTAAKTAFKVTVEKDESYKGKQEE